MGKIQDKLKEARLKRFGYVLRRENNYAGRQMIEMNLSNKRKWARPKRRFVDAVTHGLEVVGFIEEDAME